MTSDAPTIRRLGRQSSGQLILKRGWPAPKTLFIDSDPKLAALECCLKLRSISSEKPVPEMSRDAKVQLNAFVMQLMAMLSFVKPMVVEKMKAMDQVVDEKKP